MHRLGFLTLLIMFTCSALLFQRHADEILHFIESLGVLAPLFFVLMYVLATLLFLPTMVLTLAGGALFGPFYGVILNLLGAGIGAILAFMLGRYFFFNRLANTRNKTIKKIMDGFEQRGWMFVAFMRLVPILPFNLVNYGLGITPIRFKTYTITTLIFLIPPEMVYTYFGYAGKEALKTPDVITNHLSLLFALALVIALWVLKKTCYSKNPPPLREKGF